MSELICPNCGSKVVLPEHSSFGCGMTLAKDTDNNTYKLNMETTEYGTKNVVKKESGNMGINLAKSVVENNDIFTLTSPEGKKVKMKWENGVLVAVPNEPIDEIEEQIYANGYVRNTKLHRRWIMAQMFRALNYTDVDNCKTGFETWLRNHGYYYQWKMALEELRVMSKIEGKDSEAFAERSSFFTKDVIIDMLEDYMNKLEIEIKGAKVHMCHNVIPYIILRNGVEVFVKDINKKVYRPINNTITSIQLASSYRSMYYILSDFLKIHYIKLSKDAKMSSRFVDVYKREGAYYTLKNMIMFHNCYLSTESHLCKNMKDSLNQLTYENRKCVNEGYVLLAILKKTIKDNNFNFDDRMNELYNNKEVY